jgi:hypothetical protein
LFFRLVDFATYYSNSPSVLEMQLHLMLTCKYFGAPTMQCDAMRCGAVQCGAESNKSMIVKGFGFWRERASEGTGCIR